MTNTDLIAEARRNAPESVDESLIMRLVVALEEAESRVIDEHWDADSIPALAVVISGGDPAIKQGDGTFLDYDGTLYDVDEMEYPMSVLWKPEAEATR